MGKRYRSRIMAGIHETAAGLLEAGVMDKRTKDHFDKLCLVPMEASILKLTSPKAGMRKD